MLGPRRTKWHAGDWVNLCPLLWEVVFELVFERFGRKGLFDGVSVRFPVGQDLRLKYLPEDKRVMLPVFGV